MHFPRPVLLFCLTLGLTVTGVAKSDEKIQQEISAAIIKLADQAPDNFPRIEAGEVAYRDAVKTVAVAPKQSGLHASLYFITQLADTQRRFVGAQYQGADAVRRAIAAVRALPATGGAAWTLGGGPPADAAKWQIDIRRDGPVIANLTVNPADNTAILSVGVFTTPVSDPAEIAHQLDGLIEEAKRDFEGTPRAADPGLYGKKSVPRVLHSDESVLLVGPQFYSDYNAAWFDASAGSGLIRDTFYAHLDELVASGRAKKVADERDANGGRKLTVEIDGVSVALQPDHKYSGAGTLLEINKIGQRPGYVDNSRYNPYAPSSNSGASSTYSSPSSAYAPVTHEHTCVRCDGRGRIDTADAYGHYVHVTCPICGGTGKVN